jgi:hypothetical protein
MALTVFQVDGTTTQSYCPNWGTTGVKLMRVDEVKISPFVTEENVFRWTRQVVNLEKKH